LKEIPKLESSLPVMKKIQKIWSDWHKYEEANVEQQIRDMDFFDRDLCKILLQHFKQSDVVLEAGCGYGRLCFWFHRKDRKLVGMEIVPEILGRCKDYAKSKCIPVALLLGDVRMLPFKDKSFDGYVSLGVIEHFRSEKQVMETLKECKRILKTNGKAVITVPNLIVPLRHRTLLAMTRGKVGLFHAFYTIKTMNHLGNTFWTNYKIQVCDTWMPVFNIFTLLFHRLKFSQTMLRTLKIAFRNLPESFAPLKYFLGHIYLIIETNRTLKSK